MEGVQSCGYKSRILRVDLTTKQISKEILEEAISKNYIGGVGIAAYYLFKEVPPETQWHDAQNRLIVTGGPINGVRVAGAGTFNVTTKGALTNGATSSQANGFLAAYLNSCGFDGIVVHGKSKEPVYLYVHDNEAELMDSSHLKFKDTWETETLIKKELGKSRREVSVFSIGPAGENLVRFACIVGDEGHVAAHNGLGAVMGSKNLKAIAVARGRTPVSQKSDKINALVKQLGEGFREDYHYKDGTSRSLDGAYKVGRLAIKNMNTTTFPDVAKFSGGYQRSHFEIKRNPCFACPSHHCHLMKVTEGPYRGFEGEEPEYELWAAWGPNIWQPDPGAAVMLGNEVDRLGLDNNESGWIIAWLMECFEKGLLSHNDLEMEMKWGDAEAAREMLRKIAFRRGFGDTLAEGIKSAAEKIGGEAANLAVYSRKGNTLRTHDFRAKWFELFDTCVSNTGTLETHEAFLRGASSFGLPSSYERFSPTEVSTLVARTKGLMEFVDSLVICRFVAANQFKLLCDLLNEITGWGLTLEQCMDVGKRTVNVFKVFNLRSGITLEHDFPSEKLWMVPTEGPAKGKTIKPFWSEMLRNYYELMGWDSTTGKPLPDTLKSLGLERLIPDL